jgi:hypothetical protein
MLTAGAVSDTLTPKLPQKRFASPKASASNGSLPDGKAPSCLEMTKVFSPAGVGPIVLVAQPEIDNTVIKEKNNFSNICAPCLR